MGISKFFSSRRDILADNMPSISKQIEAQVKERTAQQAYLELGMRLITGYGMEARRRAKEPRMNDNHLLTSEEIICIDDLVRSLLARCSELEKVDAEG